MRILRPGVVALLYLAAGLGVYGMTLGIPLISDDYYFLGIVAPATSPGIVFAPLVGRFLRPAVVGMYYVSYHAAGTSPWLYHVFTVLPHLVTAWLIYLVTRRLERSDDSVSPVLAGLLFVVFAGHSEAVSWAAGIADPLLAVPLMAALYCYVRAIEPDAGGRWVAGFFGALVLAPFAKEAWVMFPGVLVAHALAFGIARGPARRRMAMMFGGAVALVVAYLALRVMMFGSVTGAYDGLAPAFQFRPWLTQVRAFALRCFLPSGSLTANLWLSSRDILIWPVALVLVALTARGRSLRMIVFAALATAAALVPVLPFTISVSTTESERYVYLATIFSCPLTVWSLRSIVRVRAAAIAATLVVIAAQGVILIRTNQLWRAAGTLTRSIIHSLTDESLRLDPQGTADVFVLNLPDNVGGPFVLRTGLYPALALARPSPSRRLPATVVVATQSLAHPGDTVRVTRSGATLAIDLGTNTFVQPQIGSSVGFRITSQTRTSYSMVFGDAVDRALVFYVSGGRVESAGIVEGPGWPFGAVDLPADGMTCSGNSIRFAGWALDRDGVQRIRIEAVETGRVLGEGQWQRGMRPDVAGLYPAYPNADRAGWDFELPCAAVGERPGLPLQVRVVAEDRLGHTRTIGERAVQVGPQ